MPVLALDVGGTKLAAGLVDDDGQVLRSERVPTPADPWPAVEALLARVRGDTAVDGAGIGCGGPMDWPAGAVSPLNIPAWRGFPLRDRVAGLLGGAPVRLHNDALCLAAAEHWRGAGRGTDDLLAMVVSTGVGGGLVLGGRLLDGPTGNAGHVGHVVAEPDGPDCPCGGRGCLEAVARGPAVVARARAAGSTARDGRELAALAAGGDPVAVRELARAGRAVGTVVAGVAALLDLRLVVLGGGLASSGEPLWAPLRAALDDHARIAFTAGLRVVPPGAGPEAGLVGAAALLLAGDAYWSPARGTVPR